MGGPARYPLSPSVAQLEKALELPRKSGRQLKMALSRVADANGVDRALAEADQILEGHGVEAIRGNVLRGGERHDTRYYGDILALHVNMGDTYVPTIIYDVGTDRFYAMSWGDWVEWREGGQTHRYELY